MKRFVVVTAVFALNLPTAALADTHLKFKNSIAYGNSQNQSGEAVEWANGKIYAAGAGSSSSVPRGLAVSYVDAADGPPTSTLLWQRLPGSLSSEVFTGIGVTEEGAYYAGRTWSDDKDGFPFLAKFPLENPQSPLWAVQPPDTKNYQDGAYLAVLPVLEGGEIVVYAAGYAADREKNRTAILVKYDKKGGILWAKSLTSPETGNRAAVLTLAASDGFIYAAGFIAKGKRATDFDKVIPNVALWKFDASGSNVWMVNETAYKVFLLKDETRDTKMDILASGGHLYLAATRRTSGKAGAVVLKYDTAGALLWNAAWTAKTNKGKPEMSFASGLADGKDRLFVTGWAEYAGGEDSAKDEDVIVLEVDKEYGFVLAGHEYGDDKAQEKAFGAGAGGGNVYAVGIRRAAADEKKEEHNDLAVLKYEVRKPREVRIDILPEDASNTLSLDDASGKGQLTVVIFSGEDFNAATAVNKKTLRFGRTGNEPTWKGSSMKDINKDGKLDMLCTFKTSFTFRKKTVFAFEPGDVEGLLRADNHSGEPLLGKDGIRIQIAAQSAPAEEAPQEGSVETPVTEPPSSAPAAEEPVVEETPPPAPSTVLVSIPAPDPTPEPEALLAEELQTTIQESAAVSSATASSTQTSSLASTPTSTAVSPVTTGAATQASPEVTVPTPTLTPVPVFPSSPPGPEIAPTTKPGSVIAPVKTAEGVADSRGAGRILVSREESLGEESSVPAREAVSSQTSSRGESGSGLFRAYFTEGAAAFKRARFREAAGYFREAVSLDPDSADANKYLGLALMEVGEWKAARTYLSRALELNPLDVAVREKLEALKTRPG